jgi:type IV pilus assembly protein PilF
MRLIAMVILMCILPACVTEYSGSTPVKTDGSTALVQRVALARQYIGAGDWENAKRNLVLARQIDADNAEVYEAFALVYQSTGEFELAQENFERSLRLAPGLSRARNNYAAFLYSRGQFKAAEQEWIRVTHDSLYSGRPLAFMNLGLARLQLQDQAGAEAAFTRALSMDRRNPLALLELAHLRLDAGDTQAARQYYDVYRTVLVPQSSRGFALGIRLAQKTGDADAEGSYRLALRNLYPNSPEAQALLEN